MSGRERSRALPSEFYRDPAKLLERIQERSCTGCRFEERHTISGTKFTICRKGGKHGSKCKLYRAR